MIPFRAKPNVKRDELAKAQNVSGLPWNLSKVVGRTATEHVDEAKNLAREGATPYEIYDQTAKSAPPGETGLYQNAAQQWLFSIPDNDIRLTPEAIGEMKSGLTRDWNGEWTPEMNLDRLMQADTLYGYEPRLREMKTSILQPEPGNPRKERAVGGYSDPSYKEASDTPYGRIDAIGQFNADPTKGDEPMSILNLLGHEKEHGLAYLHNLPQGGNQRDTFMDAFFNARMKPQADEVRKLFQSKREQFIKDQIAGGQDRNTALGRWNMNNPVEAELLDQAIDVGGEPGTFGNKNMPPVKKKWGYSSEPFMQYRSLGGEQTAKTAQDSMGKGIDELRSQIPTSFGGKDRLSPAFQMLKWGRGNFTLPDMNWALANSVLKR